MILFLKEKPWGRFLHWKIGNSFLDFLDWEEVSIRLYLSVASRFNLKKNLLVNESH